jgi:hypothetical protein
MLMVLLKVSRDANKVNRDNLVDICGYARNAEMIEDREALKDVVAFENNPSRTAEPKKLPTIEDYPITQRLIDEIKAGNTAREKGFDVYTSRRSVDDFDTQAF